MATAAPTVPPVSGQVGGYLTEIFQNGRGFDRKFQCNDCKLVLREPVQAFCGHRFCKSCLDAKISSGGPIRCEQCEMEDPNGDEEGDFSIISQDQTFPDNAIKREMGKLRVVCPNIGCTWTGIFRQYEEHYGVCDFKSIKCSDCKQIVRENDYDNHKNNECTSTCPLCKEMVLTKLLKDHIDQACPKSIIVCGLCNRVGIVRETLTAHQESSECQSHPIACPVGCGVIERKDYQNHFQRFQHEGWVVQEMQKMRLQIQDISQIAESVHVLRGQVEEMTSRVDHASNQRLNEANISSRTDSPEEARGVASAASQGTDTTGAETIERSVNQVVDSHIHFMNEKIASQTSIFESVAGAMHQDLGKLQRTVIELKSTVDQCDTKSRSLERNLKLKELKIAELEKTVSSLESASYDGSLIWKVTDFRQKHSDAASGRILSLYSPPFYTSRRGYKMCARLYPNGDGMGKGSHLSLFFVVTRGTYDALQKWPFTHKVTMCLINQNGGEHVVDSFRPDPQSSSFKRPTSDMNIASGCPLFIRQEMLTDEKNGFVKDDVIFLKIAVDVANLADPISTFDDRVKS